MVTSENTRLVRSHPDELIVGLVSVSDRASAGVYTDEGIPALEEWLARALTRAPRVVSRLLPDAAQVVSETLVELVAQLGCELVLTTGGTGPARRDVNPEAPRAVATGEKPGFGDQRHANTLR